MKLQHKIFLALTDIILVSSSFFLALLIRFEGSAISLRYLEGRNLFYVLSILVIVFIFYIFGLYRKVWRYAGVHELVTIFNAVTVSLIPVAFVVIISGGTFYPRGAIIIVWFINLILVGGIRFILRLASEIKAQPRVGFQKRTLIVGADDAGEMILRELKRHHLLGCLPVGFVDDDKNKKNIRIHGVQVLGPIQDIPHLIEHLKIDEIIITQPTPAKVREIVNLIEQTTVKLRTVPTLSELIDGKIRINQIREVKIEDLLDREVVHLDIESMAKYLKGKTVLITGAGGSIGSEICRQVIKFSPQKLILLGKGENSIHDIFIELQGKTKVPVACFIGDIRDLPRMKHLFLKFKPEVVFHAAAHKHVDLMEENISEAVNNNVFGTLNIADLSVKFNVERFVFLSTDKAVNPVSVMGLTKRLAEKVLQLHREAGTKFIMVRFGNVLDSKGSVIPTFRRQISLGGPVTVTHPDMTRFFMTIPEAVELVIQAGAMGEGGEIFILDMGKPIKIMELAKNMIKLSGYEPEVDIPVVVTGIRPGEKLYEELVSTGEEKVDTRIKKIYQVKTAGKHVEADMETKLEELRGMSLRGEEEKIKIKLQELSA